MGVIIVELFHTVKGYLWNKYTNVCDPSWKRKASLQHKRRGMLASLIRKACAMCLQVESAFQQSYSAHW